MLEFLDRFNPAKPKRHKSFFENYKDHVYHLYDNGRKKIDENSKQDKRKGVEMLSVYLETAVDELLTLKRLTMFDALRDGYDYFDEVVGATAVPLISVGLAVGSLALSLHQFGLAWINLLDDDADDEPHLEASFWALMGVGISLLIGAASFIKSITSLITRPLVTAISGWKPQDEARFMIQR